MLLILGGDSERLRKTFSGIIPVIEACPSMADALRRAYRYEADDVKVLYSPACDNGSDVVDEGEEFRHQVNEL
jgi:UDP-N-acetylmuramoylalanine-D-glutamate ligase